jgi:hypothetical protein
MWCRVLLHFLQATRWLVMRLEPPSAFLIRCSLVGNASAL